MRIISGLAKGRKLLSPEGYDVTRPTLDRVKESMFNIIQSRVYGSNVLDLFAGTGSLGLEAVSRGAKKCFLVDRDRDTFSCLQKYRKSGIYAKMQCYEYGFLQGS